MDLAKFITENTFYAYAEIPTGEQGGTRTVHMGESITIKDLERIIDYIESKTKEIERKLKEVIPLQELT